MGGFDISSNISAGFGNPDKSLSKALSSVDSSTDTDNAAHRAARKFLAQLGADCFDWIVVPQATIRESKAVDLYGIKKQRCCRSRVCCLDYSASDMLVPFGIVTSQKGCLGTFISSCTNKSRLLGLLSP